MAELIKDLDQSGLWLCAIDGCKADPVVEIIQSVSVDPKYNRYNPDYNRATTIRLSACKDPDHQNMITFFLKDKADLGKACLEFQARGMKLDDTATNLDKEHELMDALHKYMERKEKA